MPLSGKKILVTGAAGSIGSELVRQLHKDNQLYLLDNNETALFDIVEELGLKGFYCDIRDKNALEEHFRAFLPEMVFHAAALKHVTPSMQTPREYVKTNLVGTLNLLELSVEYGVKRFVNISTDKAVQCGNVMGWSKKGTELFTKLYGGISVRFGNVLGSRGSVIPIWQKQIDEGRPVTITDPAMERYMMSIEEAVNLVIQAAATGNPGEIHVLNMEDRKVNVLELAKQIIGTREIPIKTIGRRKGELLTEHLMTDHEKEIARQEGPFYIIPKED